MAISHILITRPHDEAVELAAALEPFDVSTIILPAYNFKSTKIYGDQLSKLQSSANRARPPLMIFTSTRAVEYGLPQVPAECLARAAIAAIGPASAKSLESAGLKVSIRPQTGYTSEDLLTRLGSDEASEFGSTFIFAAPGGRVKLSEELLARGYDAQMLMVYERRPASLSAETLAEIEEAESLLTVWTSSNAINSLSQRVPTRSWYRICHGEWLVISDRLMRLARAFSPPKIHVSGGPTNIDIVNTIRSFLNSPG